MVGELCWEQHDTSMKLRSSSKVAEQGTEERQEWFRSMWDNDKTNEAIQPESTDDNKDFGDDFDDFAEEGGDDDFGDFDEAEEATPAPSVVETRPPLQNTASSVLDKLVSSARSQSLQRSLSSSSNHCVAYFGA
jgi:hypothetical protein